MLWCTFPLFTLYCIWVPIFHVSHTTTHSTGNNVFLQTRIESGGFDMVSKCFDWKTDEKRNREREKNAEVEFDAHATMWFALQTLHIYSNHANPVKCFNTFRISFAFVRKFCAANMLMWAECGWTSMIKFMSTNDINSCRKSFLCCFAGHSKQLRFGARPSTYRHVKHCNLWPGMQIISANHLINFSLLCVCW